MPSILNREGVKETQFLELNREERDRLIESMEAIKETISKIKD